MSTLDNLAKLGITIATGAFMVAGIVAAKAGHAFYTISQLPTAAQFGAKCLSTLLEGSALIGGSVGVALATDLLFGALVNKILERRKLTENKSAQAAGYAFKRAVTVISVVGFALIMGASPIVPIAGLIVLIAKDILGLAINTAVKAYKANKLLKEQKLLQEQTAANNLRNLSTQLWTAFDLPESKENNENVNNLVKAVMEAKKLSKETKTILDEKLASGNSDEKIKAEFLIQATTPRKEPPPPTIGVDLSDYDTKPLNGLNFDMNNIDANYCRKEMANLVITHHKDGTKLDNEIVLTPKNN